MRRYKLDPRPDWKRSVERIGLTYHTLDDGSPYWDESAYWEFSADEIDRLEAATAEIQRLALAAGDAILDRNLLDRMHIPQEAAAYIRETWQSEPPALYGRLDLAFDGARSSCSNTTPILRPAWWRLPSPSGIGLRNASPRPTSSIPCMRS